jgi:hypothetical protein
MATSSCMDGRDGAVCHSVRRAFSWVSQLTQQRNINLHRTFIHKGSDTSPHINKLYEDIFERIETSSKHPITYDIISFEKLREE